MTIKAIHPFGPPVGSYVPSGCTNIRLTIERERSRLGQARPAVTGIVVRELDTYAPRVRIDDPLPRTNAFLGVTGAVFA